jgi:tripartite-type tricarboxylate transporter receptor subunit TctC
MGTFELSTMRAMGISDLTYRDFHPLAQVNADPAAILVRNDAPWNSLRDLVEDARARPGVLKMSGTAAGGAWDLARSGLLIAAGLPVDAVLWVPSQGAAPSLVELLGGHIDAVCCSIPEAQSQLDAGQLRALGVMSAERLPEYPDTRTAREDGIEWEAVGWRGLFLPQRTPHDVEETLTAAVRKIGASPAYREFMDKNRFGIVIREGDEFTAFLDQQEARWGKVIHAAGMSATNSKPQVVASADPGPWFFPRVLSLCLAVGVGIVIGAEFWRRRNRPEDVSVADGSWLRFWRERGKLDAVLFLVALGVYVAAMPWLGFFASTFVFGTALMLRLGTRWWTAAAVSTGMLLIVYLLFVQQFRVVLPAGRWMTYADGESTQRPLTA